MRVFVAALGVLLSACSGSVATPPGPLGALTLARSGEAMAPGATPAGGFEAEFDVCGAEPFAPAKVRLRWFTRRDGEAAWISRVSAELTQPSTGLSVTVVPRVEVAGESLTPGAPWKDVASVHVKCSRKAFRFPRMYEQAPASLVQLRTHEPQTVDGKMWVGVTSLPPERE